LFQFTIAIYSARVEIEMRTENSQKARTARLNVKCKQSRPCGGGDATCGYDWPRPCGLELKTLSPLSCWKRAALLLILARHKSTTCDTHYFDGMRGSVEIIFMYNLLAQVSAGFAFHGCRSNSGTINYYKNEMIWQPMVCSNAMQGLQRAANCPIQDGYYFKKIYG
jgi:hypothetical protein